MATQPFVGTKGIDPQYTDGTGMQVLADIIAGSVARAQRHQRLDLYVCDGVKSRYLCKDVVPSPHEEHSLSSIQDSLRLNSC